MIKSRMQCCLLSALVLILAPAARPGDDIPKAAWKRPLGAPLENPGTRKVTLQNIDDGYWQGAPVGGFGAGTFSRTYRGDFARWHLQGGVHKYQSITANQFAMFQKSEGDQDGIAQVLTSDHPKGSRTKLLEMGLSRRRGRLCRPLPQSLVRLSLGKIPRPRLRRTVLAHSPRQLQRNQLSHRRLSLAR